MQDDHPSEPERLTLSLLGREIPVKADAQQAKDLKATAARIDAYAKDYKSRYGQDEQLNVALMCALELGVEVQHLRRQQASREELSVAEQQDVTDVLRAALASVPEPPQDDILSRAHDAQTTPATKPSPPSPFE